MSEISKLIGQRIRNYRTQKNLSQEELAETADCHPTYIGKAERGERNAMLESIEKIASELNTLLSQLFENLAMEKILIVFSSNVMSSYQQRTKQNRSTFTVCSLRRISTKANNL